MFIKVYEKIKQYIKENFVSLIILVLCFILLTIRLPYYISSPGGVIDTKDKVNTSSKFELSGSLNMAYVSSSHATIPLLVYSFLNPDWDVEKESEVTAGSESIEDEEYRNKMLLREGNDTATLVAYKHSSVSYECENNKVYVTYVDDLAKTDLKVGDRIVSVDGEKVSSKNFLFDYIKGKKSGEGLKFVVLRDGKKIKRKATLIDVNGEGKVGVLITETMNIKSDKKVDLKFKSTESGSSGGLMLALTIYSYLNKVDLTDGKKIVGTGTIDIDGNVGEISGVKYKLIGAVNAKASVFLVPYGNNYKEALKIKKEKGYSIDIVPVKTFDDSLNYLKN